MNPMNVLRMAKAMNIEVKNVLLVGCEPETLGGDEGQMGLSPPVEAAVDEAVKLVESSGEPDPERGRARCRSWSPNMV